MAEAIGTNRYLAVLPAWRRGLIVGPVATTSEVIGFLLHNT